MNRIGRRQFLAQSIALGAAMGTGMRALGADRERRFTMDLVCGAIGVRANQQEAIELAHRFGFESVQPSSGTLQALSDEDLQAVLERLQACGLVWGAAGLPVNFRGEEDAFAEDLKLLAGHARGLQRAGATRVSTWLSPSHDRLTYLANFRLHAKRLRAVASVLDAHGLRLGLEYVGPWRSWTAKRFAFVHTLQEAQELIAEIGCNNVGLVLDSWHWYTAGETVEDLLKLQAGDIVACDLNDAPAGIELKDQIDSQRELPTASGVIDLKGFLSALIQIGYDGPVRAEPFNRALNEMDNEAAAEATAKAMRAAFALVS